MVRKHVQSAGSVYRFDSDKQAQLLLKQTDPNPVEHEGAEQHPSSLVLLRMRGNIPGLKVWAA